MLTIYHLILVEDRRRGTVSQWARREDADRVMRGQLIPMADLGIEELLFGDTAEYFVASWVTTDLREDVQEVDLGAVYLDAVHALQRPLVPERMFRSGWTLMRPPYDANPPD